ncbi:Zn-ribbon domain-containing protein [Candidatus Woesearchaeota archaeon]|nr:Zn-ribbon domain-containing protein [Candidatus Woesearchaeota archaeon]
MPHQCVRCNTFYNDGASEILKGCKCGGKLFFFVKKEQLEKAKEITTNLSRTEKKQIETDVYDLIGDTMDKDAPVVLDLESIRILKPGKFEIDLVHLFQKGQPLVYKLEEGKYMIDVASSFKKFFDHEGEDED